MPKFSPVSMSAFAAVDPGLLALVMPDAKVLTGIQVGQAEASPFGQYVLAKTQIDDAKLLELMTSTGFDPRRDLKEILAATSTTTDNALVLGRGNYQPAKIAAAAATHGGSTVQYHGFTIILPDAKGTVALTFLDTTIAAIGNQASLQAAIDRRMSGAVYSGALAQKAQAVSATN